eukprot:IDg5097t1
MSNGRDLWHFVQVKITHKTSHPHIAERDQFEARRATQPRSLTINRDAASTPATTKYTAQCQPIYSTSFGLQLRILSDLVYDILTHSESFSAVHYTGSAFPLLVSFDSCPRRLRFLSYKIIGIGCLSMSPTILIAKTPSMSRLKISVDISKHITSWSADNRATTSEHERLLSP